MAISAPGAPVPSAVSALSSMSRSRLSTSLEPIGLAGTSWNSIRWARPSAGAGYRTSRLASAFETSGASAGGATSACSSSSAASTAATAPRTHSPPFGYAKLRSSDRAASTSRPLNDGTVIRANSRYGTTLLSSSGYSPINARAVSQHSVASGAGGGSSSFKSPRQKTATTTTAPALVAYRPISGSSSISQPRAALIDMRQNLRPVNKRHSVTDHHLHHSSSTMPIRTSSASTLLSNSVRAAFAASSSAMAPPPALFTNVSPTSSSATNKCVTSPTMSRSSSSVTSPVTTMAPRPIPKSERPWRQKLADAQRLRDAQEERERHHRLPSSSGSSGTGGDPSSSSAYDATTMRLISATKSTRRTNIEQQQQEAEQKLEKQIAALKCYVSEPGALDSSATVAKFRQRMAEGQAPASLTSLSSAPSSANAAASASSASASSCSANSSSALLARMPSLNRRATTAVMQQDVQQQKLGNDVVGNTSSRKKKDRPISLVESALAGAGSRRLSVVKEGSVNGGDTSRPGSTDEQMSSPPPLSEKSQQPLATGNDGTAAATTTAQQAPPLKSGGGGVKDSPKLGKKRRTSATTTAPTVKKVTAAPATEKVEQQQSAKDNKNCAKNSDGTAVVSKRKASPKTATTTPAGTAAQPCAATTEKQQLQPAQQMPSMKRVTGNKNAENGVNGKNNGTKVPQTAQQQNKNIISSREEEGKYNAVVQFRPQSMLQRKLTTGGGAATKKLSSSSATSSASLSQLADEFDELRPVPGTWLRSTKERCISHNKHLIRRAASESTLHIHRAVPVLRVASTRMLTPGRVANKCESAFVNRLWQTHNAAISVRAKGQSPTATVLKMIKSIARPKQRICAVAVLDKALSNKRRLRLGIQKTLQQKSAPKKMSVQLRCKSAKSVTAAVRLNIMWKEQKKQVAVTIMLAEDVPEVNWCRLNSALIREPMQQQQQQKPISNGSSPLKRLLAMAQESNNGIGTKTAHKQQKQQATSVAPSANLLAQQLAGRSAAAATAKFGTTPQRQQQQQLPAKQQQQRQKQQHQQPGQAAHFGIGGAQQQQQQAPVLILPDQSLLERYVQHKRDALDQLHNSDDDDHDAAGDAAAAVDEALHTVTTPSAPALFVPRTAAAAAVVSASLPGSKRNSQMLAAVPSGAELPQSLTGSFHSAIEATAADLRAAAAAAQPRLRRAQQQQQQIPILSTQTFEKPKSLFEEQMQRQAIQLRQRGAVARHSLHDDDAEAAPAAKTVQNQQRQHKQAAQAVPATQPQQRRQRSGDATALGPSPAVADAVVGTTHNQQLVTNTLKPLQHEQQRYAAHIPLSGRQSTTSCESANSGTQLDSATRRLDQMIDQARYRHSQHRNKFKEAIDYLDHIFEDFQREAADSAARPTTNGGGGKKEKAAATTTTSAQQKHQQQLQQHAQAVQDHSPAGGAVVIEPVQATFRQGSVKSAKEAFEKVAAAIASDKQNSRVRKQPSVPTSSSSSSAQQQQQKPAKVPLRSVPSSSFPTTATTATATVAAGAGAELADVEVAETIVLPSKHSAERLDFTKHWVSGGGGAERGGAGGAVAVWAQSAPHRRDDPLLGIHGTESSAGGYESDEHSLGSCSAEVAAINAADQQRRRRHNQQQQQQAKKKAPAAPALQQKAVATVAATASAVPSKAAPQHQQQQQRYAKQANVNGAAADRPMLPQIVAAPSCATSRPQPFRPQPQLGVLPPALIAAAASTSGYGDQQQMLQKVPSIEQLRLMRSSQERAGSQDYHSMASSVHSQDGFRPAASCLSTLSLQRIGLMGGSSGSGAFHSYTPTTAQQKQSSVPFQPQPQQHQLKGSIQSLPDSALCTAAAAAGLKGYGAAVYSRQQPSSFGTGTTVMAQKQQQKQPVNGITTNHRQFATLARMDSSNSRPKQGAGDGSSTATTAAATSNCLRPTAQRLLPTAVTTTATTAPADHASAIDALVAELELNTADTSFASAEKRRSFPTMQTEVATRTKAAKIGGTTVVTRQQLPSHNFTNRSAQQENGSSNRSKPLEKLNELIAMDDESSTTRRHRTAQQQQQQSADSSAPAPSAGGNRPFETINQEKLNPSKVDAMARMFNGKQQQQSATTAATSTKPFTSGGSAGNNATSDHQGWATRRAATIGGRAAAPAVPSSSVGSTTARHGGNVPPLLTNGHHAPPVTATTARQHNQQQHSALKKQYTLPAMASVAAAAATMAPLSSRIYRGNGAAAGLLELGGTAGRCRTNGTGRTTTAAAKRDGAGTPTVVDDDHGGTAAGPNRQEGNGIGICAGSTGRSNFYDNVQSAARNGRCGGGRTSPAGYSFSNDSVSLCSQSDAALPPATSKGGTNAASNGTGGGAGGRIGQLIRKLGSSVGGGGGGAKVPSSATSTLSLNRVFSNEMSSSCVGGTARDEADGKNRTSKAAAAASCAAATVGTNGNGTLTKSTSLSGEPWRYQVMMEEHQQQHQNGGGRRMEGQQSKQLHQPQQQQQQNGGIGNRLKQTIFGSAIRRRVPT